MCVSGGRMNTTAWPRAHGRQREHRAFDHAVDVQLSRDLRQPHVRPLSRVMVIARSLASALMCARSSNQRIRHAVDEVLSVFGICREVDEREARQSNRCVGPLDRVSIWRETTFLHGTDEAILELRRGCFSKIQHSPGPSALRTAQTAPVKLDSSTKVSGRSLASSSWRVTSRPCRFSRKAGLERLGRESHCAALA